MSRSWLSRLFGRKVSPTRKTESKALQPLLRLEDRVTPAVNAILNGTTLDVTFGAAGDAATLTGTAAGGTSIQVVGTGFAAQTFNGVTAIKVIDGGANAGQSVTLTSVGANAIILTGDITVSDIESVTLSTSTTLTAKSIQESAAVTLVALNTSITTTDKQTFNDSVTLTGDATLTSTNNGDIEFSKTLDGGFNLTVNTGGGTNFFGTVGGITPLKSLATDAAGLTRIAANATTTGIQSFGDQLALFGDVTVTSNSSGAISFAQIDNNFNLTVNTAGATNFNAAVGSLVALNSLTTDSAGTTSIAKNISTNNGQSFNDSVTLTGNSTLASVNSKDISFGKTLDGGFDLTVNTGGGTNFFGTVGGMTPLKSLATDAAGLTRIAANATTTGIQSFGDQLALFGDVTVTSNSSGAISFAQIDNNFNLTVNTAGATNFNAAVGSLVALNSLTTDSAGTTSIAKNISTNNGQSFNDSVTLTGNSTLASVNSKDISFGKTLDGGFDLTVNTGGTTTFAGVVGGSPALKSLTTDSAGTTKVGASITTVNKQTFNDSVTLTGDATLTSTNNGDIEFSKTLDGGFNLTVNTGGGTNFFGTVGGMTPLKSLATDAAGLTRIAANATTTGIQSFGDQLALFGDVTVTSNSSGAISFAQIDNNFNLTVDAKGAINFNGKVGSLVAIKSLAAKASSPLNVAANITVAGDITLTAGETADAPTFADNLTVNAGVTVKSTGGTVALQAGDDVVLSAGASVVSSTKSVGITAAFGDLDGRGAISFGGSTVSAATDASLLALDDITVGTLTANAATGIASVTSTAGNIFDDGINATVITGDKLTLSAVRAIGATGATANIDTTVNSVTATTTGPGPFAGPLTPGIWIADTDALTVTSATTNDGLILIDGGASLDAQTVAAGGTGRSIRLRALGGDLTVSAVSAAGDIVSLSSTGKIIDGNAATNNVTALSLLLNSNGDVATAADPLETTVSNLAWNTGVGSIDLVNTGTLTVTSVSAFGSTITGGQGTGHATVTAKSPFTVAANVVMAGDIVLTAGEISDSPTFADDLTVNATVTVQSTGGNVTLQAGDEVEVNNLSTIKADTAGKTITLVGGFGDLDAEGAIVVAPGAVPVIAATNLALTAVTGIASVTDPLRTTVSNLEAQTTTGGIFLTNTGDLSIGGVSGAINGVQATTSGDIQLINTGSITFAGTTAEDLRANSGNVLVQAIGATADISTRSNSTDTIDSNKGNVTINAGRDILLGDSVTDKFGDVEANGDLTLLAGRDIVIDENTFADAFGTGKIIATAGRDISLLATDGTTGSRITTEGGSIALTTGAGGKFTSTAGGIGVNSIQNAAAGGDITITADDMIIADAITAGAGCVTLSQATAAVEMDLGTNTPGKLSLTDAELDKVSTSSPTGGLIIGRSDGANTTITGAITQAGSGYTTILLKSGGSITEAAGGTLAVTNLAVQAGASVTLAQANDVGTLAITAAGDATFNDSNALTVGSVVVCPTSVPSPITGAMSTSGFVSITAAGLLTISNAVTAKTDVALSAVGGGNNVAVNANITATTGKSVITAAGSVDLAADVSASTRITLSGGTGINQTAGKLSDTGLEILGGGTATLTSTTNNVATVAANFAGDVIYVDANDVAIGTVGGTANITATGKAVRLESVAGKITGSGATDVTAASLVAKSATGIGTLNTKIASLESLSTTGDITVNNTGDLTIGGVAGDVTGVQATAGNVNITVNATKLAVTLEGITAGTDVNLAADAMDITQPISGQCVTLKQFTAANKIDVGGADAAGILGLDNTELNKITTTKGLQIGQAAGGAISVSAAVKVAGPLELQAGAGGIARAGAGTLEVANLLLQTTGKVTMDNANKVSTLAGKSGDDFTFTNDKTVKLAVDSVTVCGDTLTGIDATGKKVTLTGDLDIKAATIGDCVIFAGATPAGAIDLGTEFTDTELDFVQAKVLQVGTATTSALTVSTAITLASAKVPTLDLRTAGTVTGAGTLAVQKLAVDAGAAVTLSGGNDVDQLAAKSLGAVTFNDSDDLTVDAITRCDASVLSGVSGSAVTLTAGGDLTVNKTVTASTGDTSLTTPTKLSVNDIVKATAKNITLNAEAMAIAAGVTAPAGCVDLQANKASTTIDLGAADAAGVLGLTDTELDFVTTLKGLRIGQSITNKVQISAAIDNSNSLALLSAAGGISETGAGALTASNLQVTTTGVANLSGPNKVANLAGSATGDFTFNNADTFIVGSVTVCDVPSSGVTTGGTATITSAKFLRLQANVAATNDVVLAGSAGGLGQEAGAITGKGLAILGSGTFFADQPGNDVNTFAANVSGITVVRDADDLTIGTVGATSGVTNANADLFIRLGTTFNHPVGQTISLGTGAGEVRTGLNDDGTGVMSKGTNFLQGKLDVSPLNGFALYGGTNSNSFEISPALTGTIFLFGGKPEPASVSGAIPGDQLSVSSKVPGAINLVSYDAATGNGIYTFAKTKGDPVAAIVQFFSIEKVVNLTFQATAVQTGVGDYKIVANAVVNGQAQDLGFSAPLPQLAPFLASPGFTNPFGPFDAPYISISDVNGDGVPDVIIGFSSNSGSPLVTVVNSGAITANKGVTQKLKDSDLIAQFFAYDPRFQGGVFVAAADFDGDGRSEIVTGPGQGVVPTDKGDGNFVKVFKYFSGPNPETPGKDFNATNNIKLETRFFGFDPTFQGGTRVAVGNVNGDLTEKRDAKLMAIPGQFVQKPDIIAAAGPGGGPLVRIFNGQSLPVSTPASKVAAPATAQFYAYDQGFRGGVFVDGGDYNSDGKADILTGAGYSGGPHVKVFDGFAAFQNNPPVVLDQFFDKLPSPNNTIDYQNALRAGVSTVGFADDDGDGLIDIFVGSGLGVRNKVRIYANLFGANDMYSGGQREVNREFDPNPGEFRVDGAHVANSGSVIP